MVLNSKLFRDNKELQDCAKLDTKHIVADEPPLRRGENNQGEHVALIHKALRQVMPSPSFGLEEATETYGPKTAEVVRQFKAAQNPPILNKALRQTVPDNIVGKLTIDALDKAVSRKPPVKPVRPSQVADIVVRYIGSTANGRISAQQVVPDPLIATYQGSHAADRLTRIGANTATTQANDFLNADLKLIQEVTKNKAVGKICIFGTSSGANNALILAQRVLALPLPLAYVGVADPVFFPSDTTDRPTKNQDPPDVIPTFRSFAGIRATDLKENFFQVEGNHTRREKTPPFRINFTSDSTIGGEIHGELQGFQPRKIPILGETTDFDRHKKLGDTANPVMQATVAGILNKIPSDN